LFPSAAFQSRASGAPRFVDAEHQPLFEGPPPAARLEESGEKDAYLVTLRVRKQFDDDVFLIPGYDVRLNEPPYLIGDLLETLDAIRDFTAARVLPTVRALLGEGGG
jgi:hypothetical protein